MVCYLLLVLLFSLAVIFGAGLVTSLSPCTLSVLPLTLGYIGKLAALFHFQYQNLLKVPKSVHWNMTGAFGSGKSRTEVISC